MVVFVGRAREIGILREHYALAVEGQARIVLLAGEPGIGKSRLMLELARWAEKDGAAVMRGGASEAEGMPPYLPILEAVGQYIKGAPLELLRAQVGDGAGTLVAIFPEIGARLGEMTASYALPPEQSRLRLYEATGDLLAAISEESPIVLMLDDLHWADSATFDLLSYVVRRASEREARLLVVGTYRPGDAQGNAHFGRALHEWSRLRLLATVALAPLPEDEIADLAREYLGEPEVGAIVGRLLYAQSEGNPFFAEELLSGWIESGVLRRGEKGWTVAANAKEGGSLPQTIVAAVRVRLERLPAELLEDLRMASIIGRTFDVEFLAETLGVEAEMLETRLRLAVQAGLIGGNGDGSYAFSHDKIRESLYSEVTVMRRRRLHGFIGRVLEARSDRGAQTLAELAFHYAHSGDKERGARFSRTAGDQAMLAYAPMEAAGQYETALRLMEADDDSRGEVWLKLGEASILAEDIEGAVGAFAQGKDWFLKRGDRMGASKAAHGMGRAEWRREHIQDAAARLQEALALADDAAMPHTVTVLCDLATLMSVSLARQEESVALARRAYDMSQGLQDGGLSAVTSRTLGNLLVRSAQMKEGMALLEQALGMAVGANDPVEAAECCACMALGYAWMGKFRQSAAITWERLKFAQVSRQLFQLRHVYGWLSMNYVALGDIAEATRLLSLSAPNVESLASPEPRAFQMLGVGYLAYLHGDYEEAMKATGEAIEIFREIGPGTLVWYLGIYGLFLTAAEKWDELRGVVEELEGLAKDLQPMATNSMEAITPLALIGASTGDKGLAARSYARLLPFAGLYADNSVDRALGECAMLMGDYGRAREHLRHAEEYMRQEGLVMELARTLRAQGRLAIAEGAEKRGVDRESQAAAVALWEGAVGLFEKLGMKGEEAETRALIAANTAGKQKKMLPAGLSEREAEVLKLVASGMTNRDIAAKLFLSEKTVANHITNIFLKTNSANRVEASSFAMRHGLA